MADLNFAEYVAGLVEKARKAQAIANNFTQEDVDLITAAVTYNLTKPEKAKMYAEMLVEESGMGIPEDKVGKIYGKVWGAYLQMKGQKSKIIKKLECRNGLSLWALLLVSCL